MSRDTRTIMDFFKKYLSKNAAVIIWALVAFFVSATLFLVAQFITELKAFKFIGQGAEFSNTITISGRGEVFAIPDMAQFSFAVLTEAKTVEDAQEGVTKTMNTIISYLKKEAKVSGNDIKTTNYNIVPRYEYKNSPRPTRGERALVGYEVSHWIEVKVRDTEGVGELLSGVGQRGATNVSSVQFTIDDEEKVRREARRLAIADAEEKARELARDLGVRIVQVVSFNEGGGATPFRTFAQTKSLDFGGVEAPQIPAGENKITSNVTITYAIK